MRRARVIGTRLNARPAVLMRVLLRACAFVGAARVGKRRATSDNCQRRRGVAQPGQSAWFGTKKSQVQILSPRLFFKRSPLARTSKGFLIVGTGVAARRSCSYRAASWSNVPDQLTQPLLALHDRRFKSCRQLQRQLTDPLHGRPTRIREILDRTGLGGGPTPGQRTLGE
jgi:hypothetical protein